MLAEAILVSYAIDYHLYHVENVYFENSVVHSLQMVNELFTRLSIPFELKKPLHLLIANILNSPHLKYK